MIPTTTGAARAVGEVLPELKGKLDGSAIRVPVPDVSLIDLTFTPGRDTSRDEVNQILKAASESERLKGILDYTDEPLVSIDLMHTPRELDHRQPRDGGDRGQAGARAQLVRQRMGLLEPHGRHRRGDGEAGLGCPRLRWPYRLELVEGFRRMAACDASPTSGET